MNIDFPKNRTLLQRIFNKECIIRFPPPDSEPKDTMKTTSNNVFKDLSDNPRLRS